MGIFKTKQTVMQITPYVPGESKGSATVLEKNNSPVIKLSSNEGPFGPSPMAIEAIKKAAEKAHRYPEGDAGELREILAKKNGINPSNIICGAGSDEIIAFLCNAFAGEGTEVLHSQYGFLMYSIYARAAGATPVAAPEKNYKADPVALLNKITEKTRLIFLANPNNPTGTYWTKQEIIDFHAKIPADVILVLDAAYAEFVDDPAYTAGHELVEQHSNIVVTRTFSKLYGLGGIRLGWGHASDEVIGILNRIRGPFNTSSIAQAAGIATLKDDAYLKMAINHNMVMRAQVRDFLTQNGLFVVPSQGNFVLTEFKNEQTAENCRLYLKDRQILVRQMGGYGLPAFLRISIGLEDEMALALDAISGYLKG